MYVTYNMQLPHHIQIQYINLFMRSHIYCSISISIVTSCNNNINQIYYIYYLLTIYLVKKVFPTNDFLGWYSTTSGVAVSDLAIHKQFLEINESPIYLVLDAAAAFQSTTRDLPITVFESELHVVQDQPTMLFVKVPYRIQTGTPHLGLLRLPLFLLTLPPLADLSSPNLHLLFSFLWQTT